MKSEPNPDWKPPTKEMRGEGAGKGDQLRRGVNWKQYGENYDEIFRKPRLDRRLLRRAKAILLADQTNPGGVYLFR